MYMNTQQKSVLVQIKILLSTLNFVIKYLFYLINQLNRFFFLELILYSIIWIFSIFIFVLCDQN